MPSALTLIQAITVGSGGTSSFDFTSIPATFTDLKIVVSARSNRPGEPVGDLFVRINNDTANNYGMISLIGDGTNNTSAGNSAQTVAVHFLINGPTSTANTFSNGSLYIANYLATTKKTISCDMTTETNGSLIFMRLICMFYEGTSAVNRVTLFDGNSATILQHSTAYLYGIKNS